MMDNQYVDFHDEGYWIRGTRISLDSIVYAFRDGYSPETISRDCFPDLSLEEVYGAVTYYLSHQAEIDAYLLRQKEKAEQLRQQLQAADPEWYARLAKARQELFQSSMA
jgi:uncharacterized protein (DUF433 family)